MNTLNNDPTIPRPDELPEGIHSIGDVLTQRQRKRYREGQVLIGRYRILGELGQGGMGIVYKCLDQTSDIEVAVKMLPPEVSRDSGEMEEVRENFKLVARLAHPYIATVRTLEKDEGSGEYLLVMDLASGVSLRQKRKQAGGKLGLAEVAGILRQIAGALDYAHSQKVIHRDIKPSNVIVAADGSARVLDFGLAAQIHTSMSRVSQVRQGTSGTGPYMAPEQWRGQYQDARTDQYSLAVMAYELLAGRLPFESHETVVLRSAVLEDAPERPDGLPEAVWSALQRGLAKKREERFGSCTEFVEALAGKRGAAPTPAGTAHTKKSGHFLVAAALFAIAAGGFSTWWWTNGGNSEVREQSRADDTDALLREADNVIASRAAQQAVTDALLKEADAVIEHRANLKAQRDMIASRAAQQAVTDALLKEADAIIEHRANLKAQRDNKGAASRVSVPVEGRDWTSPATEMEFVWVDAMKMWVGKYEVTNGESRKMVPGHSSKECEGGSLNGDRQPVVFVNFDDGMAFAKWMTEQDKASLGRMRYRLPSNDEFDKYAQCGDGREFPWGDNWPPRIGQAGNYGDETSKRAFSGWSVISGYNDRHAVACNVEQSWKNPWGLFGVGGNVWEGCASDRVISSFGAWRGGSWCSFNLDGLRCAYRYDFDGSIRDIDFGFRLVLAPP